MKVISLWQPWASYVAHGLKLIETRSRSTSFRGTILVHASSSKQPIGRQLHEAARQQFGLDLPAFDELPFGSIIGKVDIIETFKFADARSAIDRKITHTTPQNNDVYFSPQELAFGDYSEGRTGYVLRNAERFQAVTPAKGKVILWDYDAMHLNSCVPHTDDNDFAKWMADFAHLAFSNGLNPARAQGQLLLLYYRECKHDKKTMLEAVVDYAKVLRRVDAINANWF